MKFGVREICDVVLKAKAAQKIGNKVFYKNEPVLYFDSLKTSSMEGASTTVYAQGGRGNARLVAWEGERTVTFTMEDALISPIGFSILTGAGLIDATASKPIIVHTTEQTDEVYVKEVSAQNHDIATIEIYLKQKPYLPTTNSTQTSSSTISSDLTGLEDFIYVMLMRDGEIVSEPYIPIEVATVFAEETSKENKYKITLMAAESEANVSDNTARYNNFGDQRSNGYSRWDAWNHGDKTNVVLVDYYTAKTSNAFQVDITPDKFGGNFYLEASTLFRDTNGVDMPAEFIIPNCKVQSNFTFTMASSGDPSTFTFTMDAFPDYTRFDKSKKVLAAIQVIDTSTALTDFERLATPHDYHDTATNGTWGWGVSNAGQAQKKYFEYEGRGLN